MERSRVPLPPGVRDPFVVYVNGVRQRPGHDFQVRDGALVFERSLIKERRLLGYRYDRFWCMDTFKEQQQLTDLYNSGRAPWEVWKRSSAEALV